MLNKKEGKIGQVEAAVAGPKELLSHRQRSAADEKDVCGSGEARKGRRCLAIGYLGLVVGVLMLAAAAIEF